MKKQRTKHDGKSQPPDKRIKNLREWIVYQEKARDEKQQFALFIERENFVRRRLTLPLLLRACALADTARTYAHEQGARGLLALIDQRPHAADHFSTSIECLKWVVKLRYGFVKRHIIPDQDDHASSSAIVRLPDLNLLLCHSIVNNHLELAKQCFEYMTMFTCGRLYEQGFVKRRLEPVIYKLCSDLLGRPWLFNAEDFDLNVYELLLQPELSESEERSAYDAACHFRTTHIEVSMWSDAEFGLSPFDIYPIEIHALLKLRRELGYSSRLFKHPYLEFIPELPLGTVRPEVNDKLQIFEETWHELVRLPITFPD
jgi:hypothetical protein